LKKGQQMQRFFVDRLPQILWMGSGGTFAPACQVAGDFTMRFHPSYSSKIGLVIADVSAMPKVLVRHCLRFCSAI